MTSTPINFTENVLAKVFHYLQNAKQRNLSKLIPLKFSTVFVFILRNIRYKCTSIINIILFHCRNFQLYFKGGGNKNIWTSSPLIVKQCLNIRTYFSSGFVLSINRHFVQVNIMLFCLTSYHKHFPMLLSNLQKQYFKTL